MDLDDLLKSIREEGEPKKGGAIVPAKFFGEDRYDKIYQELLSEGKIEGDNLSPEERKEGVKAYRKSKIDFEKFVDRVLKIKQEVAQPTSAPAKAGLTSGTFMPKALPSAKEIAVESEDVVAENIQEDDLDGINEKLDDLLDHIRTMNEIEEKQTEEQRKKDERERREKKENKREKVKNFLLKPIEKALKPVNDLFSRIIGGLFKILAAKALIKLIDWFTDPANKEKVNAIGRFVKDFWPAILAGFLIIGTGLGGLATTLLGTGAKLIGSLFKLAGRLGKITLKLGAKAFRFAAKNPLLAAGALVVGTAAVGGIVQSQTPSNDPERAKQGKTQLDDTLNFGGITGDPMGGLFAGGGLAPKGTDVVPAMLTPGEFVMSKGAVDTFGTDFMESINAAGGGTNRPQKIKGAFYAQGGGATRRKPKPTTDGEVDTAKGTTQKQGEGGVPAVVSAGKMLLGKGFTVAEHKNFKKNSYSGSGANKGVGFNPRGGERVGGHSSRSLHYKNLAIDVTDWRPGDWKGRTFALAETMYQNREKLKLTQIIHDPWGSWFAGGKKGGAIGGHDTHLHLGFASGPGDAADVGDFNVPSDSYAGGGGGGGFTGGGGGGTSTASAITPPSAQPGSQGMTPVPIPYGQQGQGGAQSQGSDVPDLGSIDPHNMTLLVMKSMYNLSGA